MTGLDLFDLSGRTAVVTGGGGHIGRKVAGGLAAAGARVALVDLNADSLEDAAEEIAGVGERPVTLVGDTSRPEGADAIVDQAVRALGRVDILFSNVGSGVHTVPEELSFEVFSDVIRINLHSGFLMTQGFGRHMIAEGIRGSIVSTSSTCGALAMGRGNFAYSLAKAAVNQLTRELAIEWGHFGIRVNAIAPCQLDTPGVLAMLDDPDPSGVSIGEHLLAGIPLARLATAEDMVGPVLFLASDAAAMITGTVIPVDGGNLAANSVATIRRPATV
ncbi:MAG: NAD-dependent epimerase/dehydratase [Acidimicrobiaceae bacterium]|nr:NAD-dependent epimerase/dehydratase [Acidimicrobiaceae bacterium]